MTQCPLIAIISKYYETIIQILSKDIASHYNLQNNSTKCLNTCIILIYILFGSKLMIASKSCNTHHVRKRRNQSHSTIPSDNIETLQKSLYRISKSGSMFYYIMLTDAHLPLKNTTIYFPGHTFIIEKTISQQYYIYQSYINKYNLHTHMKKQKCKPLNVEKVKEIIFNIKKLCNNDNKIVWDYDILKFWKDFTNVDTYEYLGAQLRGIHFCFKRYSSKHLYTNLEYFSLFHTKKIQLLVEKQEYDYYNSISNEDKSLSIFQLKNNLDKLKKKIDMLPKK